jgi:hypothetical protein
MTRAEGFVAVLVMLLFVGIQLHRKTLRHMEGVVLMLIAALAIMAVALRRWVG